MPRAMWLLSFLLCAAVIAVSPMEGTASEGPLLLSGLEITANGTTVPLSPSFASAVLDVTGRAELAAEVGPSVERITITPRVTLPGLTIRVGGIPVSTEHPSVTVPVAPGETASVEIHVTRAIGGSATYELSVTRVALSGLALTADGSLVLFTFSPETSSYSVTVGAETQALLITPGAPSSELTIAVNGTAVSASQPSVEVSLAPTGATTITIGVSGPLGLNATYELVVTRAEATLLCNSITVKLDAEGRHALTAADIAAITGLPQAAVANWQATPEALDCGCVGDAVVSVSGQGPAGAQATCTATVHVIDDIPPVVEACPPSATMSLYAEENQKFMPDLTSFVQAADNCGLMVTQSPAPGTAWPLGETSIELGVSDPSGNEATPCQAVLTLKDLPYWPMNGQNSGRTNSSLVYGLTSPWFKSVYPQTRAAQESGMTLELLPDFVMIGMGGTVFVRARERGPQQEIVGEHLLAIDPERGGLLWSFPTLARAGFIPAVGDDGTVYCFGENGWLCALDPEVPAGSPRLIWTVDLSSLLPAGFANALGQPLWEQFPGVWIPYWQPILIGPEGDLYVSYRNFTFAFGPPPDRPLLWVRPGADWAAASAGPDGVFYTRSWRGGSLEITAIDPTGTERWTASVPAASPTDPYRSPAASIVTAGGNLVLPITSETGRHDLIVLSGVDGRSLASYPLPSDAGEPVLLALDPQGTLFVVTQTALQPEQGRDIALHAFTLDENETHLELLWSTALGVGWPDALVVDATETAHVCVRRAAREEHAWSDNSELLIVNEGAVCSVLPVWGQVGLSPDVISPGTNLALGKGGSLYRVAESARTNDPGGRGTALIETVTSQDPLLFVLEAKPQYHIGAPPVEFLFTLLLQDPLLRFKDFTLSWDFGDGAVETDHVGGDRAVGDTQKRLLKFHTYASLGTFPVHVALTLDPEDLPVAEIQITACAQLPEIQQIAFRPSGASLALLDAGAVTDQATLRAYVGQSVEFACSTSVPCAGFDRVEWRFGDGQTAAGRSVSHTYSSARTYTIEVRVGETPLLDKKAFRLEILPLPDLLVIASPDTYSASGLWVHFRVELSEVPPHPLPLVVDLGDGNTERWETTERVYEFDHVYTEAGTYAVEAAVLETGIRGETTVDYRLPALSLRVIPSAGFAPLDSYLACESLLAGWPTEGLTYEWTIDNEILTEWTTEGGVTHHGPPGNAFPYRFTGLGTHAITCYARDPNSRSGLSSVFAESVLVIPLPVPPEPDGIRVPFLKDPGIPSGSECRWACGGNCPESCVDHADVVVWILEPIVGAYYRFTYSSVIACGTHEGCRWHDDCFDACAAATGESEWWEACHMGCNDYVAYKYPLAWGYSWQGGGGPYDGWFLYSDPPTWEGPFATPLNSD